MLSSEIFDAKRIKIIKFIWFAAKPIVRGNAKEITSLTYIERKLKDIFHSIRNPFNTYNWTNKCPILPNTTENANPSTPNELDKYIAPKIIEKLYMVGAIAGAIKWFFQFRMPVAIHEIQKKIGEISIILVN